MLVVSLQETAYYWYASIRPTRTSNLLRLTLLMGNSENTADILFWIGFPKKFYKEQRQISTSKIDISTLIPLFGKWASLSEF